MADIIDELCSNIDPECREFASDHLASANTYPIKTFADWVGKYVRLRTKQVGPSYVPTIEEISAALSAKKSSVCYCAPYLYSSDGMNDVGNIAATNYICSWIGNDSSKLLSLATERINNLQINLNVSNDAYQVLEIDIKKAIFKLDMIDMARRIQFIDMIQEAGSVECARYGFMYYQSTYPASQHGISLTITKLTRMVLLKNVDPLHVWNNYGGISRILGVADCADPETCESIKSFFLTILAKQKLLFRFLLASTPHRLEELCNQYMDINDLLRNSKGNVPKTRAQKLLIASNWKNLILADILHIESMLSSDKEITDLIMPQTIDSSLHTIEI